MGRKQRSAKEVDEDIVKQLRTMYNQEGDCWEWQGQMWCNGYGRISRHLPRSTFSMRAHIASYQLHVGPIPQGLFVCHSCDNKTCINPKHLWLGTNKENQDDAVNKGKFKAYWTLERRAKASARYSGVNNPMYGVRGKDAPCFGRTGDKHPMFGKHHTTEVKEKISASLISTYKRKRK